MLITLDDVLYMIQTICTLMTVIKVTKAKLLSGSQHSSKMKYEALTMINASIEIRS